MHKIEVQFSRILAKFAVSLFTGERIEIRCITPSPILKTVSLFTGERIEMFTINAMHTPSLTVSLFTGERIEIGRQAVSSTCHESLPLYGGAD